LKILLLRLRLIGDVVFTTPAIRAIRRALPDATLTYLVERAAAPVVAHNPHLDELLVVDHRRGLDRVRDDLRLAARVRRARYDVVVDFHGGPRTSWLARASGAPRRIGYDIPGRAWLYTDVVARPRQLRARHSVENQWDLLAAIHPSLSAPPDPARDAVQMEEDAAAAARVSAQLDRAGVTAATPLIVLHVSAGNPFRRWPPDAFVDTVAALSSADSNRRIILTSGPSEPDAAARIGDLARARIGPDSRALVTVPEPDLAELRALVARAALFIGGDSGPLHVAATTATPIVGVFGPTLAARSAPWRDPQLVTVSIEPGPLECRPCDQRHCAPGDFRCLTGLDAARVVGAAERALAARAGRLGPLQSRV
jgi:ADP-heptose:LPS heptosyltransferase